MKKFSQFMPIKSGRKRFKQAPVAAICYALFCKKNEYPDCNKIQIVITGNETFNFQAADSTVYYKNSDFVNVPHKDIVHAQCTHFKWDDGAVIADLDDGGFLFNYTKSTGIGTGNISFRRDDLFTSSSVAKDWFKGQVANGTPVTITVYVKK